MGPSVILPSVVPVYRLCLPSLSITAYQAEQSDAGHRLKRYARKVASVLDALPNPPHNIRLIHSRDVTMIARSHLLVNGDSDSY